MNERAGERHPPHELRYGTVGRLLRGRRRWPPWGRGRVIATMPKTTDKTEHPQPSPERRDERPACATAPGETSECPRCAGTMRLWAGFYRCPNCGYKESCCF